MAPPETAPTFTSERRQAVRVAVARCVRVAHGLRVFEAELLDLSSAGCRLRCPVPIPAQGHLWFVLPAGLGGRLPLPIRGEVARTESVRGAPTGVCEVALQFRRPSGRVQARLAAALRKLLAGGAAQAA
jgi:hypothetical protein